jgi:hypothetical protein
MKVVDVLSQEKPILSNKERQRQEVRAKIANKFGDKFETKDEIVAKKIASQKKDKLELSDSAKRKAHIDPEGFGDIKKNDPNAKETQAKLKGLLENGGFEFNEKERMALSKILK